MKPKIHNILFISTQVLTEANRMEKFGTLQDDLVLVLFIITLFLPLELFLIFGSDGRSVGSVASAILTEELVGWVKSATLMEEPVGLVTLM